MHGFINSPALAKLVALQMVDEELQPHRRRRTGGRLSLRARLVARRTTAATAPARSQRAGAGSTSSLVEEAR